MPFLPGQGGRPKGAKNHGHIARDLFAKLGGPHGKKYAKQLHALACGDHDDIHARIKALAIIAPYIWGKPKETIGLEGGDGGPVVIQFVDAE